MANASAIIVVDNIMYSNGSEYVCPEQQDNCYRPSYPIKDLVPTSVSWNVPTVLVQSNDALLIGLKPSKKNPKNLVTRIGVTENPDEALSVFPEVWVTLNPSMQVM